MSDQTRLIDAEQLYIKMAGHGWWRNSDRDLALEDVDNAPTIDPESLRPVGRWVPVHEAKIVNGHLLFADGYECSECHEGHSGRKYCEECGTRMEEAEHGTTDG